MKADTHAPAPSMGFPPDAVVSAFCIPVLRTIAMGLHGPLGVKHRRSTLRMGTTGRGETPVTAGAGFQIRRLGSVKSCEDGHCTSELFPLLLHSSMGYGVGLL